MLVCVSEFAPMDLSKLSHVDSLIYLESGIRSCRRINFEFDALSAPGLKDDSSE